MTLDTIIPPGSPNAPAPAPRIVKECQELRILITLTQLRRKCPSPREGYEYSTEKQTQSDNVYKRVFNHLEQCNVSSRMQMNIAVADICALQPWAWPVPDS